MILTLIIIIIVLCISNYLTIKIAFRRDAETKTAQADAAMARADAEKIRDKINESKKNLDNLTGGDSATNAVRDILR